MVLSSACQITLTAMLFAAWDDCGFAATFGVLKA
jgi:hypothetical protein